MGFARTFLRVIVPRALRRYLRDKSESVRRALPGEPRGLPHFGLAPTQVYPAGVNFDSVLLVAMRDKLQNVCIHAHTRIVSIGTCFAEEFAFYMLGRKFNYLLIEPDALSSSANWGRVYTIPNLYQIVRYSLDPNFELCVESTSKGWIDPLREHAISAYPSRGDAILAIKAHREASRRAFTEAEVLIMTLGQNEAWVDRRNNMVWGGIPPKEILTAAPEEFSASEFSYQKNCSLLGSLLTDLFALNPLLQVILTVSPVASYATFCDIDVVSQSFANKCLLRSVVRDVMADFPGNVSYFPSFEMVLGYNPANFRADNRHVKYATVDRIFTLFEQAVVKPVLPVQGSGSRDVKRAYK